MTDYTFVPKKPFADFKWKWGSLQCTEGINDPVVLLGILFRMAKLEGRYKYSSEEFAKELISLDADLQGSGVNVDLKRRVGERNIIRNSGQYWRALNLIPSNNKDGIIRLTDFGRKIAEHSISQSEFSAITIMTYTLPNPNIQSQEECNLWKAHHIKIQPLKLILSIIHALGALIDREQAYITKNELIKIVIPLSAYNNCTIDDYANFISAYRKGELDISAWADCCPAANDHRIAREFLLFLAYYGYLNKTDSKNHEEERFYYNYNIEEEIQEILHKESPTFAQSLSYLNQSGVTSDIERKRVDNRINTRGYAQTKFRNDLWKLTDKCVLSSVRMREVLIAAHIVPVEYNGSYDASNGFLMRSDLHTLFDTGHIRISVQGDVLVDEKTRNSYGYTIPERIFIPEYVNKECLRWRFDNYNGI